MISRIINPIFRRCKSVYLTGSCAKEELHNDSDIDLIIVTMSESEKNVESEVYQLFQSSEIPEWQIDLKVFTESELQEEFNGINHFFFWSLFNKGILLWGNMIKRKINLQKVIQSMQYWLNRLDETGLYIESGVQYTRCCYDLYAALVWFYFINRELLLDDDKSISKKDTLSNFFSGYSTIVYKNYQKIISQSREIKGGIGAVRIKVKDTQIAQQMDFRNLLVFWNLISNYCNDVYQSIMKNI